MLKKLKNRGVIPAVLLTLILAVGALMPSLVSANDDPQEGGRTRSAPRVTCTTTSYSLFVIVIVVTECSDGTRTVSVS